MKAVEEIIWTCISTPNYHYFDIKILNKIQKFMICGYNKAKDIILMLINVKNMNKKESPHRKKCSSTCEYTTYHHNSSPIPTTTFIASTNTNISIGNVSTQSNNATIDLRISTSESVRMLPLPVKPVRMWDTLRCIYNHLAMWL